MSLEGFLKYPFIFALGFLVTFILVPPVRKLALALGAVDYPGERRLNVEPIPRIGGLAIFCGFHLATAGVLLLPWNEFNGLLNLAWWNSFLIASTMLLLVGIVDDCRGISPIIKLVGQIIAATFLYAGGTNMDAVLGFNLPPLLNYVLTVFWFLGFINAINLIDGLDGLATGIALIAALGLAGSLVLRALPGDALIFLGLAGACVAFLRYNFYPASIFLGDTGSMFLGFALAAIALESGSKSAAVASIGVPMLAVGVPVFDTALAIWRRTMRSFLQRKKVGSKFGVMSGDMEHVHHRLLRFGLTQRRVALLLYLINALLVGIGLLSSIYYVHATGILLLAFLFGAYVIVRHVARTELWDSGRVIASGLRKPSGPVRAVIFLPVLDALVLIVALGLTIVLVQAPESLGEWRQRFFRDLPFWCAIPFIGLFFSKAYSRVWSRSRISEFVFLGAAFSFIGLVSMIGSSFFVGTMTRNDLIQLILFLGFAGGGILAVRAFPRAIQDLNTLFQSSPSHQQERLLIYGAGNPALLYLRELSYADDDPSERVVVGYVDDDRNLRKRFIHGHQVLGNPSELSSLILEHQVTEIVLTVALPHQQFIALETIVRGHRVRLVSWRTETVVVFDPVQDFSDKLPLREAVRRQVNN